MILHTAQYQLGDPDGVDITIAGAKMAYGYGGIGKHFAPTWEMVMGEKKGLITQDEYTDLYHTLMLDHYARHPEIWLELLNRKRVVLKCFCKSGNFCHRILLAEYLMKVAAHHGIPFQYAGELVFKNYGGKF